jgi:hypothetical protein
MSLAAFHTNLKALLLADAGLSAWATTHFGLALTAVDGNVPVEVIRDDELPALIFELGDGTSTILVGGQRQDAATDLLLALVWHEEDPVAAFAQRTALPELLVQAVMADPTLTGVVDGAWVSSWEPDRNVYHPRHVFRATVRGELAIQAT